MRRALAAGGQGPVRHVGGHGGEVQADPVFESTHVSNFDCENGYDSAFNLNLVCLNLRRYTTDRTPDVRAVRA